MNKKLKQILVRDSIIGGTSLILAMIMFFIAKYVFIKIEFTILGAAFMTIFGAVIGGWIYHILYTREVKDEPITEAFKPTES